MTDPSYWACFKRFDPELHDTTIAPLSLKLGMLNAEIIETLLYGCATWTLSAQYLSLIHI